MGQLQDALDRSIEQLPRIAAEKLIREKLLAIGVDDPALVRRITDAVVTGDDESIEFESEEPIDLEFTEADLKRIQDASAELIKNVPELIDQLANDASRTLTDGLKEQWLDRVDLRNAEISDLRRRIARNWHEPFDRLKLLNAVCSQEGEDFNMAHLRSKPKRGQARNEAIIRLHIRACRIADEIVLLLEHGHVEGAQGRWRTLHEVMVTATLIAEGGDGLAERYFAHEAIERKRALDDHRRQTVLPNPTGLSGQEALEVQREFDMVVRKYGRHFRGMYGWASEQLGLPAEPQFYHLQEVAGSLALKLSYRLASFDTHASPRALAQPLHCWDPTTHIPGAFAAGFEWPASEAAHDLVRITTLLISEPWDLDKITLALALKRLHDEVVNGVHGVARRIEKEEQRALDRAANRPGRAMGYVKRRPL